MGYCYELDRATGRRSLVCDRCGHAGGVHKVPCPHGYCPASALCTACRKDPEVRAAMTKAAHAQCGEASARMQAEADAIEALHAAGEYTFAASVYEGDGVRVWFRNGAGDTRTTIVSRGVRDCLSRLSTWHDLERHTSGPLAILHRVVAEGTAIYEQR